MRLHPVDGFLYVSVRLLKFFDKRQTDLDHFDAEKVRGILLVSSTAIGDTLLSTPAIRAVRERYPKARIVAHFNRKNMELFEDNPDIDGVIPYYGGYKKFLRTIREFRRQKFDFVIIFHGNEPQATPMAYLSGARFICKLPPPRRNGFLLSNRGRDAGVVGLHNIDMKLKSASFFGCAGNSREMVLTVREEDRESVRNYLAGKGIRNDDILIGFQVGAANRYKVWPAENFVLLGSRLLCNPRVRIVITGSQREKKLCSSVADGIGQNAVSVAGELTLRQVGALVKAMNVLVTNDTGTMHMAVALGTRTVSLFCPTDDWGVGPIQDIHLHKIIKKDKPCNRCITKKCTTPHCMELIAVDEVFRAVEEHVHTID
jgi:ADP-heptose:LPS heptosyltransferase